MWERFWLRLLNEQLPWLDEFGIPPQVFAAVLVLLAGFVIGLLLRVVASRMTRGVVGFLSPPGTPADTERSKRFETAVGSVAFWSPLVLASIAATRLLELPLVSEWLTQVAVYLPRLIAAILVLVFGLVAARGVGRLVLQAANRASVPAAERLRRAIEISIVVASLVVAVEQLGLEISFLKTLVVVTVSAILLAAGLAFGLGSRDIVANVLAAHYLQRVYQVGQVIRAEGVEGRIVRITEIALIVDDGAGEVVIPAQQLTKNCSTLVLKPRDQ